MADKLTQQKFHIKCGIHYITRSRSMHVFKNNHAKYNTNYYDPYRKNGAGRGGGRGRIQKNRVLGANKPICERGC